jgi:flagellar assembly protein FliH
MSDVLPKHQQSAYQRWEMASFDEDRSALAETEGSAEEVAARRAELDVLREHARQEGYAEGVTQGYAAGLESGRVASSDELENIQKMAQVFGSELAKAGEVMASELLDLSLDLAKGLLKTALPLRPELVLPIVAEAIHYLPSVQQPSILFLHPADAKLARDYIGDELSNAGWRISEDLQMGRGGCRVETPTNQIDASMPSRWHRIATALGKNNDWLDE